MDSHLFDEKVLSIDQRIEENIKREKALNEKGGWVDCTEFPYRSSSKQELWGRHLGIEITSKELFAHTQTRRRVGRGGRIIFDRQTRLPGNDFMVNERDVISDPIPLLPCLEYLLLTSRPSFRAFEIGPKDEEYVSLQNHPTHNLIFDPQKSITDKDRRPPYLSPPQIVKLPLNPGHQTQRKKYPKSSAESRTSTKKKTPEVVLDPRAQAVKTMMRQAQQQAQQTQANLVMNNRTLEFNRNFTFIGFPSWKRGQSPDNVHEPTNSFDYEPIEYDKSKWSLAPTTDDATLLFSNDPARCQTKFNPSNGFIIYRSSVSVPAANDWHVT